MKCLISLIVVVTTAFSGGVWAVPANESIVAPFVTGPVVDGKMEPGEWDLAFQSIGFQSLKPMRPNPFSGHAYPVDPRLGKALFGYTSERLYIAVATELPPDGKLMTTTPAGEGVSPRDDAIEIWIDPNRDTREHAQGARDVYQLVVNSSGTKSTQRILTKGDQATHTGPADGEWEKSWDVAPTDNEPGTAGSADVEWKGSWEIAQTVDTKANLWVFEASIPWSDFKWKPEEVFGRSVGILISRNYQRPAGQLTWSRHDGWFHNSVSYPRLVLRRDCPTVQIKSLSDSLFEGRLQLTLRVANPTEEATTVTVWARGRGHKKPQVRERKDFELAAKSESEFTLDMGTDKLGEEGPYELNLMARGAQMKQSLLTWSLNWQRTSDSGWDTEE